MAADACYRVAAAERGLGREHGDELGVGVEPATLAVDGSGHGLRQCAGHGVEARCLRAQAAVGYGGEAGADVYKTVAGAGKGGCGCCGQRAANVFELLAASSDAVGDGAVDCRRHLPTSHAAAAVGVLTRMLAT